MSDHEADFSANGHEAGSHAVGTETQMGAGSPDENTFLAELARAMQATAAAEQARNAEGTEQRRQAHIDAIRAREALEAEELRELAKDDVKGIDAWSDGEIKRIKLERERRIAARRDQLQIRLEEHRNVVSREVEAVEAAIAAYKAEIEIYFRRLEAETDPVVIAKHAGTRPPFPVLDLIGPDQAPAPVSSGTSARPRWPGGAPGGPMATRRPSLEEPVAGCSPKPRTSRGTGRPGPVEVAPVGSDGPRGRARSGRTRTPGDSPFIGVMDPEPAAASTEKPWEAGSDDAAPVEAPDDNARLVAEEPSPSARRPNRRESPEPVGAVAEARVVMPKATGAGFVAALAEQLGRPLRQQPVGPRAASGGAPGVA